MDALSTKCIAKLDSLANCSSCGAVRRRALGGKKNRNVAFSCDAAFFVEPRRSIGILLPCPRPSNLTANYLHREIIETDHRAVIEGGVA